LDGIRFAFSKKRQALLHPLKRARKVLEDLQPIVFTQLGFQKPDPVFAQRGCGATAFAAITQGAQVDAQGNGQLPRSQAGNAETTKKYI